MALGRKISANLLLLPQRKQTDTGNLHHLEAYSRNVTLGFTPTTETRYEDFVVLINKVQATIVLQKQSASQCIDKQLKNKCTGTNAVTFFPFLINCTRTHLRMAELGCLASTPTFSNTMPFACEEPPVGDVLYTFPRARFL